MKSRLSAVISAAIAEGLLPQEARGADQPAHPWPVILLTALGAWLVILPLLGALGLFFGTLFQYRSAPYLVGLLVLIISLHLLRNAQRSLFLEQLAFPLLVVGLISLAFGFFRDFSDATAAALLGVLALMLAVRLPQSWIQVLLGMTAALGIVVALTLIFTGRSHWFPFFFRTGSPWLALHLALALWLLSLWGQTALAKTRLPWAAAWENIGSGWILAVLVTLAWISGMTFLVGSVLEPSTRALASAATGGLGRWLQMPLWLPLTSVLLMVAAHLWGAWRWPSLGQPWVLGIGLVLAVLAWFLPSLGGVWLVLSVSATTGRWRLAGIAALAAIWILGSFYYQLQWPLAQKALILLAVGLGIGLLAWWNLEKRFRAPALKIEGSNRFAAWLILLSALSTLGAVNFQIWQKEQLIAQGQPVFVPLAPVDPRSLMQGDYMRLRFAIPSEVQQKVSLLRLRKPRVVARRDARGVATLLRLWDGKSPLAPNEFLLALRKKNGRWGLVSDAWYFREGEAERWQRARYGEFRVGSDGEALLVGLADESLQPIDSKSEEK